MESTPFDTLEAKINQIIAYVDKLHKENQTLKERNRLLDEKVQEQQNALGVLQTETDKYRGMVSDVDTYREKQDLIQAKVESLLDKLKEFDDQQ